MKWSEIRQRYPDQWLVLEAVAAHTTPDKQRHLDQITVVEMCADGKTAWDRYQHWHQQFPQREFYYVHTSRSSLDIREQTWVGIRHAVHPQK